MNFAFTEEEEAFRREVKEFITENITDEVRSSWLGGLLDTPARRDFVTRMADRGWLSMGFPEEYGGTEQTMPLAQYILNQELHTAQAPIVGKNLGVIVNTILHHGSERLKQEFVPRVIKNEIQWALAYTEPEAGSDLANMQCRAVLDGDEYVINGQKRFITSAHFADYLWTGVRTDPNAKPKHRGISLLIIDVNSPGITITPLWTIIGERSNDVFFDNVRVPKEYLVGDVNEGWRYITEALTYERFTMASVIPTIRKFGELVEWVKKAEVDGRPLRKDPIIRRKIGHLAVLVEMARMLDMRCVCMAVRPGYVPYIEAMMNKMWGGIVETVLTDTALDIMAPYGYLWNGPEAPLGQTPVDDYLWAGHQRVAAAGVDLARNTIARRYLGLPSA
ncbi:MAG TPA: acyl-CoA dehydrogenase family protein [Dehalococcoidia bacterium]|nr:acyl-CoA dehydrogenase family protein [Dehalococcoidia bacterium]